MQYVLVPLKLVFRKIRMLGKFFLLALPLLIEGRDCHYVHDNGSHYSMVHEYLLGNVRAYGVRAKVSVALLMVW